MSKFRKKPVVIEARAVLDRNGQSPESIAAWCGGCVVNNFGHPSGKVAIQINTLEGAMTAQYGDWIIRGVQGEFYPCKPDIFAATYEAVDEASHE